MKVTVDTSAIIAVIANEASKEAVINETQGVDLIAPNSLRWEVGNALSAMFKQNRTNFKLARDMCDAFTEIPVQYVDVRLKKALRLADKHNIYAYDAYMLVCANTHQTPLITLDEELAGIAQNMNIKTLNV
ncbi:MAG: VapC toxin family PIN domain ribonuclease [Parcubacteria group bacterium SW_6_46_9]|nr:MAG: VapC toxin family PIN domain ribonuclease [Parcubacteria group bacterium SW_6_46_9]